MGLITKIAKVQISSNNVKYYENLGYTIPTREATPSYRQKHKKDYCYDIGKEIEVKVEDLSKGSHVIVECQCDYCGREIVQIPYKKYIQVINSDIPKITCKKCRSIKNKESLKNLYGVECTFQLEEVQKKVRATNQRKRGVNYPTQSPEVRQKIRESVQNRYGVDYVGQLDWVMEKKRQTMYEHFGTKDYLKSEECKEKIRKNNLQKYGVEHTLQVKEFREKGRKTMFNNQTAPVSIQQQYLCNLYNGYLNYPIEAYSGDIVLVDDKIDIEYDGGGHFLSIICGDETEEQFNKRQIIRYYTIKRNGYKQINIVSRKDYLPSVNILLQMLEDAKRYFKKFPNHSWVEFDIDNEVIRNAENKNGTPYFFGELRRIKKNNFKSA